MALEQDEPTGSKNWKVKVPSPTPFHTEALDPPTLSKSGTPSESQSPTATARIER